MLEGKLGFEEINLYDVWHMWHYSFSPPLPLTNIYGLFRFAFVEFKSVWTFNNDIDTINYLFIPNITVLLLPTS